MADSAVVCRTFQIGRYEATITVPRLRPGAVINATCEWNPHKPYRLSASERLEYQAAIDAVMTEALTASQVTRI